MSYFADSDEVYFYIGGILAETLRDPELGPRFAQSGVVLKLSHRDPDATLVVDMPNRRVLRGDAGLSTKPTLRMAMSADVAHRFWLGQVNISVALARGDMRAKGPLPKILKLVPLARQVFPRYRALLVDTGRDDLLLAP